jgi:hypothetical protein
MSIRKLINFYLAWVHHDGFIQFILGQPFFHYDQQLMRLSGSREHFFVVWGLAIAAILPFLFMES